MQSLNYASTFTRLKTDEMGKSRHFYANFKHFLPVKIKHAQYCSLLICNAIEPAKKLHE